jgi:hypothetical protein
VANGIRKLLSHIVRHYTGPEEVKEVERDAPGLAGVDLDEERSRALKEEQQRASNLDGAFRAGLQRARSASKAGGDAISLDDRDSEENQIADALVHFLVGPGMAVSKTRQTAPQHYTYTIWVDWERLEEVAREADVDLDQALDQAR